MTSCDGGLRVKALNSKTIKVVPLLWAIPDRSKVNFYMVIMTFLQGAIIKWSNEGSSFFLIKY